MHLHHGALASWWVNAGPRGISVADGKPLIGTLAGPNLSHWSWLSYGWSRKILRTARLKLEVITRVLLVPSTRAIHATFPTIRLSAGWHLHWSHSTLLLFPFMYPPR